jgi:hypothetical protein
VHVTQDILHVIMRSRDKIAKQHRAEFGAKYHQQWYKHQSRELFDQPTMFHNVRQFLSEVPEEIIASSQEKWEGTMFNTLRQIFRGDFVPLDPKNMYEEKEE